MVWVHERTIPTELPPFVGEVSANFNKNVLYNFVDSSINFHEYICVHNMQISKQVYDENITVNANKPIIMYNNL
jgi:hypothetical protein